ncbi:MAG TPA: hypothetical protein VMV20_06365 [Chitinophagaceae bacterium]|nr:hypothetical protein [Chitinophagaceae bacterium]
MRKCTAILALFSWAWSAGAQGIFSFPDPSCTPSTHDLAWDSLAATWDDGMPLGNGMLGALVWQKGDSLRFSLDRADLWDLRPVQEFDLPQFRYDWIRRQVKSGNEDTIQKLFDRPYDQDAAPTKIPGAALQFADSGFGKVVRSRLYLDQAVCEVDWAGGQRMRTFIDSRRPIGWFRFDHLKGSDGGLVPVLIPPDYSGGSAAPSGDGLYRLGYPAGSLRRGPGLIRYHQQGWGGFSYDVVVRWIRRSHSLVGCWSIQSGFSGNSAVQAESQTRIAMVRGLRRDFLEQIAWWKKFWSASAIRIADSVLENQWYREIYKFGSASRTGAPPITLQAVWTADDGKLPPWKGDFHHDLNTELSYWPGFESNHLEQCTPFTDWLWKIRPEGERYTRLFFQKPGLDIPGVTTLTGAPMGGWIQYSLSPTVSCWLAQSFYWQWKYSLDTEFLKSRAYPWMKETATFLAALCPPGPGGLRKLPLSTSPEIHDNSLQAWFTGNTNYDLSLIRWLYGKAAEMARTLGLAGEASRWEQIRDSFPKLSLSPEGNLLVAPHQPLEQSHRHMSNLMAIFPLGLYDQARMPDRKIIQASLAHLDSLGTSQWCGYSFAWYGCLLAQARLGDQAARALRIFSTAFCLPNSFHVNGDQTHSGYSDFTYRPFTLEGNFAFAEALQQMLLQSQDDTIRIFPAIPERWKQASFHDLRAQGAFLVSAARSRGKTVRVRIQSLKGGWLRMENPFAKEAFRTEGIPASGISHQGGVLVTRMRPGQTLLLTSETPGPGIRPAH